MAPIQTRRRSGGAHKNPISHRIARGFPLAPSRSPASTLRRSPRPTLRPRPALSHELVELRLILRHTQPVEERRKLLLLLLQPPQRLLAIFVESPVPARLRGAPATAIRPRRPRAGPGAGIAIAALAKSPAPHTLVPN